MHARSTSASNSELWSKDLAGVLSSPELLLSRFFEFTALVDSFADVAAASFKAIGTTPSATETPAGLPMFGIAPLPRSACS